MSNPSMDNLFLDPTWQDPDVSMAEGSSQGLPAFATPANMARPSSTVQDSGADDPFSQLSLSRGTSGETLHADCGHTSGKGLAHIASYCIAGSAHLWLRACFYRQKKCRHRRKSKSRHTSHAACSKGICLFRNCSVLKCVAAAQKYLYASATSCVLIVVFCQKAQRCLLMLIVLTCCNCRICDTICQAVQSTQGGPAR